MSALSELNTFVNEDSKKGEMLQFYFQLMGMTKHMVDGILPDILLDIDGRTLENIIQTCDELNLSLQVFKKLCSLISRKNLSSRSEMSVKVPEQTHKIENNYFGWPKTSFATEDTANGVERKDRVWSSAIQEATDQVDISGNVINFYYCGSCDFVAMAIGIWKNHMKSEQHVETYQKDEGVKIACESCGLHILANSEVIDRIMDSAEHQVLDQKTAELEVFEEDDMQLPETLDQGEKEPPVDSSKQHSSAIQFEVPEQLGSVIFKGINICGQFVQWTSQITRYLESNVEFTVCYCRPCDIVSKTKVSWTAHCSSEKHLTRMANTAFRNVLCLCLQCPFGMIASKPIATKYMYFHIERCHKQSSDGIVDEEFVEMKEIFPKTAVKKSRSRNRRADLLGGHDIKGSNDTLNSSRRSSVSEAPSTCSIRSSNNQSSSPQKGSYQFSADQPISPLPADSVNGSEVNCVKNLSRCSSIASGSHFRSYQGLDNQSPFGGDNQDNHVMNQMSDDTSGSTQYTAQTTHYDHPSPQPAKQASRSSSATSQVSVDTGNDYQLSMFIEVLRQKKSKYLADRSYKPFGAICFVCNISDFRSQFEWFDHINNHESNHEQNEIECSQCNTVMFGSVKFVGNTLITHPYHLNLDDMMA